MRDGPAERGLPRGLRVGVNELVVAGNGGEGVDHWLVNRDPG